jgi:Spy/CpxP family protein refolding chaperone
MVDEIKALHRARQNARGYAAATREMAEFLERMSAVPDPEQEAEYATLLAREESVRALRQDALHDLGLEVRSIEEPAE